MDIKELDLIDPRTYWYYQAKLVAIQRALVRNGFNGGDVVDVGAGSGFFSEVLVQQHPESTAWCIDPNYTEDQLGRKGESVFIREASSEQLGSSQTFLFIDVLEHVEDDCQLLSSYVEAAPTKSLFAISVPAFMSLWSGHDVFLEHYRRYRLLKVDDLARRSGLEVLHSQYLFGTTFLPLWIMRRLRGTRRAESDLRPIPRPVNSFLKGVVTAEHRIGRNPICGSSVLLIGQKP